MLQLLALLTLASQRFEQLQHQRPQYLRIVRQFGKLR